MGAAGQVVGWMLVLLLAGLVVALAAVAVWLVTGGQLRAEVSAVVLPPAPLPTEDHEYVDPEQYVATARRLQSLEEEAAWRLRELRQGSR
jgi:hypothetical protein